MRKIGLSIGIIGALGVLIGAFGAHGVKGKISDQHYNSYRVGVEYLFFHLAPLLYIVTQTYNKVLQKAALLFIFGILFFTGSNVLMTTEAIHHINFHFLWPVTPLGGILFVIGWLSMSYHFYQKTD
ncbi:MAG: DUF423 domain-containing protein [Chitinophagales bacterium]|nr:DUF423 domain-containing protein [Chitinophagales bacterium]